jgi:hypothetical protein
MLITNIATTRAPVLSGTARTANRLNLQRLKEIRALKDDGHGGYWVYYKSDSPGDAVKGWFRIPVGALGEVIAIGKQDRLDELVEMADQALQGEVDPARMGEVELTLQKFTAAAEDFKHLVKMQMGATKKAAEIARSLLNAQESLMAWLAAAQQMATPVDETEV